MAVVAMPLANYTTAPGIYHSLIMRDLNISYKYTSANTFQLAHHINASHNARRGTVPFANFFHSFYTQFHRSTNIEYDTQTDARR